MNATLLFTIICYECYVWFLKFFFNFTSVIRLENMVLLPHCYKKKNHHIQKRLRHFRFLCLKKIEDNFYLLIEVPDHVYVLGISSSISDCCISIFRFSWCCLLYSDFLRLRFTSSVSEVVEACCCISILRFNRYLFLPSFAF